MPEHEQHISKRNTKETATELRRVRGVLVKPLWETNRYDGPLSGVCFYNDKPFYFDTKDVQNETDHRKYLLHPLSDETFQALEEERQTFKDLVGEHCEYNPDWTRVDSPVKATWQTYFERQPENLEKLNPTSEPAQFYFYIPSRKS